MTKDETVYNWARRTGKTRLSEIMWDSVYRGEWKGEKDMSEEVPRKVEKGITKATRTQTVYLRMTWRDLLEYFNIDTTLLHDWDKERLEEYVVDKVFELEVDDD